jgi:CheY-like chemotaxis protein
VDAHELVRQAVEICRENVGAKGLELTVELGAGHPHVRADAARLQQVLWNLINNAVKFTPAGGRVSISTRNGNGEQAFVGSASADGLFIDHAGRSRPAGVDRASGDGTSLVIEVADNGVGIEPEMLPRIFKAFEQGEQSMSRRYGGLGLGLAITKALVDAHRGRLSAQSGGRNQGSTFSLELATVDAPAAGEARDEERPPALGIERSLNILLVEDHEDTSRIMSMLLRGLGHGVRTAPNMAAALEASSAESFDLVISDIGLPDGSGIELMRQLKEKHAELRGIALSGFGMEDDVLRSKEAGFVEHITKPVNFQRLEGVIRRVASVARAPRP